MTFYIDSLGCAKNQVDSELMIASLEEEGLTWVTEPDMADIILVNTCGFIQSAKEESIQTGLELKQRFRNKTVIMTGCLVQRYEQELKREMHELDGFIWDPVPQRIAHHITNRPANVQPANVQPANVQPANVQPARKKFLSFPGSAFVKAAEGCSNHCSYCAIPLIRGKLISRSILSIVSEIYDLLNTGIFEINLIAQDLASFGMDRGAQELPDLLKDISAIKGDFRIRLLYLHPDRFHEQILDIIDIINKDTRFFPYFDLPFQHASKAVLERMGRTGSSEIYLDMIHCIRNRLANAVIRSTFLVGFPGESNEDFKTLQDFQKRVSLDWLGIFVYSREEGTPAYSYSPAVGKIVAQKRKESLEEAQIDITASRLESVIGRTLEVLIEEDVQGEDLFLARSYLHAPEVDGLVVLKGRGLKPGDHCMAKIVKRNGVDLEAVVVHE